MDDKEYAKTKEKRVARYQKESDSDNYPKFTKAMREYVGDPVTDALGKVMPSGKPHAWEKADREARQEVLGYKKGGMTASKRADGIAQRGKTRGTIVMCGGGMYKK